MPDLWQVSLRHFSTALVFGFLLNFCAIVHFRMRFDSDISQGVVRIYNICEKDENARHAAQA
jgi:hypothetical protein